MPARQKGVFNGRMKKCFGCENSFYVTPFTDTNGTIPKKFCSNACYRDYRNRPAVRLPSFWAQVTKGPGCWLWTGWKLNSGYGETTIKGKKITVHRLSYMLAYGPIPKGKLIMHTCDVPLCVRPDHLRLGTDADNRADSVAKNRHAHGEMFKRLAKLTERKVLELRRLRRTDPKKWTGAALGKRYGITASSATGIWLRYTWRHLP